MISVLRTVLRQCQERFFQARCAHFQSREICIARQQVAQDRFGFRGVNFECFAIFFYFFLASGVGGFRLLR